MTAFFHHPGTPAEELPELAAGILRLATCSMADLELGTARLGAVLGPCAHPDAVPVDLLVTGEVVAWLCPGCDRQLPAGWDS